MSQFEAPAREFFLKNTLPRREKGEDGKFRINEPGEDAGELYSGKSHFIK